MVTRWPDHWQHEARAALQPYFGADSRVRIIVGPPDSLDGTVLEGFIDLIDDAPTVLFDRSGGPDVYPWPLLQGPVLRILALQPRRKPTLVFAHAGWTPRLGE